MDFLWVRWFKVDETYRGGFAAKRLHRVEFTDMDDPIEFPFGFLNPSRIMRAAHLIPGFAHGRVKHQSPLDVAIESPEEERSPSPEPEQEPADETSIGEPEDDGEEGEKDVEEPGDDDEEPKDDDDEEPEDDDDKVNAPEEEEDETKDWKYHYVDL